MVAPELPVQFGRYRLTRLLGRGGMAEVFLAELQGPGGQEQVAVKRLLPHFASQRRFVRMLEDEAQIAAAIRHPHVAQVREVGVFEGAAYLAMEYVDGVDLARVLRAAKDAGRDMPVPVALYVAKCIAEGLHAAHTLTTGDDVPLCITHRDVSPHNVLVSSTGDVKLIDFGVAKAVTNRNHTRSGVIKGKLQYMSPEQARAQPIDARSDVFSLGTTLYKLLTGRLPFVGPNEFQLYEQICKEEAAPPSTLRPDIGEDVDAIVLRAMRKAPARRFATAADMAVVVERALRHIAPGFGATDLAAWLAAERAVEAGAPAGEEPLDVALPAAPSMDDARIDALTSIQRLSTPPASSDLPVAIAVGPPPSETGSGSVDVTLLDVGEGQAVGPSTEPRAVLPGAETDPRSVFAEPPTGPHEAVSETTTDPRNVIANVATEPRVQLGGGAPTQVMDELPQFAFTRVTEPTRTRRRVLGWAAAAGVAALVAGAILLIARRETPPAPVVVSVEQLPRAADPERVEEAPRPRTSPDPSLAPVSTAPTTPGPAPASAPPPPSVAAPARPAGPGYVTVTALPWAWVEVNGRLLDRQTPIQGLPLPPGRHTVRLLSPDKSQAIERKITIRSGRSVAVGHKFE